MTGKILEQAGALTVLVRRRFREHARAEITGSGKRCIDIGNLDLDEVRHNATAWYDLIGPNIGDDDGAIGSDTQLGAMVFADAYPFAEAERGLQPRYCCSHIRIDQHRSDGGRRCGTIRQHRRLG